MPVNASRAQEIFLVAIQFRNPLERHAYIEGECGKDMALQDHVFELIYRAEMAKNQGTVVPGRPYSGTILQSAEELDSLHGKSTIPRPKSQFSAGVGVSISNSPLAPLPPQPPPSVPTPASPSSSGSESSVIAAGLVIDERYRLLELIDEGGMGQVWKAQQLAPVRRQVAIKFIKSGWITDRELARFDAEVQALALMNHPHIASVLDGGATKSGSPYIVMELVQGVSIKTYCDNERLSIRERLDLFLMVCDAVEHIHQKGIIHRDLKPKNILVYLQDGVPSPKVLDFGIAKSINQKLSERTLVTQMDQIGGTIPYMSPEQVKPSALGIDTRSDIYSMGAVLNELLAGCPPFSEQELGAVQSAVELIHKICEETPPKPSVRLAKSKTLRSVAAQRRSAPRRLVRLVAGDLDAIVLKCLAKERAGRYGSAAALAQDIERFNRHETILARTPSALSRLIKFLRRNRGPAVAACTVFLALIGGIVLAGWGILEARDSEKKAVDAQHRADDETRKAREQAAFAEEQRILATQNQIKANQETLRAKDASGQVKEQRQLALDTLYTLIDEINNTLKDIPAHQVLRKKLLENAIDGLQKIVKNADIAANADRGLLDVFWELGKLSKDIGANGTDQAMKYYQLALDIAERIAKDAPQDRQAQKDLGIAIDRLAQLKKLTGDTEGSRKLLLRLEGINGRLSKVEPENKLVQRNQSVTLNLKARSLLDDDGDVDGALTAVEESMGIVEKLAKQNPSSVDAQNDLAATLYVKSLIQEHLGDAKATMASLTRSIQILEPLVAKYKTDHDLKSDLALVHAAVGRIEASRDDLDAASTALNRSLELREELFKADPTNSTRQVDLCITLIRVSNIHYQKNESQKGLELTRRALKIIEPLANRDRTNIFYQHQLAFTLQQQCVGQRKIDDYSGALDTIERAINICEPLTKVQPHEMQIDRDLAVMLEQQTFVFIEQGTFSLALAPARRALAINASTERKSPKSLRAAHDVVRSLVLLGRVESLCRNLPNQKADAAKNHFQQAIDKAKELADHHPPSAVLQGDLLDAYYRLGLDQQNSYDFDAATEYLTKGQDEAKTFLNTPTNRKMRELIKDELTLSQANQKAMIDLESIRRQPAALRSEIANYAMAAYIQNNDIKQAEAAANLQVEFARSEFDYLEAARGVAFCIGKSSSFIEKDNLAKRAIEILKQAADKKLLKVQSLRKPAKGADGFLAIRTYAEFKAIQEMVEKKP